MNESSDSGKSGSEASLPAILSKLTGLTAQDLEDKIRDLCQGNQSLEAEVRASLETQLMSSDDSARMSKASLMPKADDQAKTAEHEEPMLETLDLDVDADSGVPAGGMNDATIGLPDQAAPVISPDQTALNAFSRMPENIAGFAVIKLLGSGGMGSVYLAQQEHPHREVAVKIMKLGLATPAAMQRFEFEVETLARLVHPGIAELHEAGIYDGSDEPVPYVAMEYVKGARPITSYVADLRLETRDCLKIFRNACDGVAFGHARGVIHRDLKPPNILVDEGGAPKVIDFGVARATEGEESNGRSQIVGTLQYMSPEQIAGSADVDTSTDVYAMGLILYEILARRLPYIVRASTLSQARQLIDQSEAPLLGSINPEFAGDLEMICAKAIEKDPSRRYRSASELGDDIQRYLDDEPVLARPPSTMETLRRVARKRKPLVAMISLTIFVIIGALISVSIFAVKAEKARQQAKYQESVAVEAYAVAEAERKRVEQVALAQKRMLVGLDPMAIGETIRTAINRKYETALENESLSDDDLAIIKIQRNEFFRNFDATGSAVSVVAEHMVDPAYADMDILYETDPRTAVDIRELLAEIDMNLGRMRNASEMMRTVVRARIDTQGKASADVMRVRSALVGVLMEQGKLEEALSEGQEALKDAEDFQMEDDINTATMNQQMGAVLASLGRLEEAKEYFSRALQSFEASVGTTDQRVITIRSNYGLLLLQLGKIEEAEKVLLAVYDELKSNGENQNVELGNAALNLAEFNRSVGNIEQSIAFANEAVEVLTVGLGRPHPTTLDAILGRGTIYLSLGELAFAENDLREVWLTRSENDGNKNEATLLALERLGLAVAQLRRLDEAIDLMQTYVENSLDVYGATYPSRMTTLFNAAILMRQSDRLEECIDLLLDLKSLCESVSEAEIPQCANLNGFLLTVYNELSKKYPDSDWPEKAKMHEASF